MGRILSDISGLMFVSFCVFLAVQSAAESIDRAFSGLVLFSGVGQHWTLYHDSYRLKQRDRLPWLAP
jgi:hypothetical protein